MPFTPYHMGPAFPVKGASGARFSLLLYGYTQVLMDIEALYRILNHEPELHGFSHTFIGATLIGAVALVTGKPLVEFWLKCWNRLINITHAEQFLVVEKIHWKAALSTVAIGSWLHIVLDAIMHHDVHPFAPFSEANPFLRIIDVRELHLFCITTALFGLAWIGVASLLPVRRPEN
ncbi:MAG: hypothetical protein KDA65_06810 [Planctomycetaceae bacterium]|nr:hypothetical protein [Planctomycetaceae bacterium]